MGAPPACLALQAVSSRSVGTSTMSRWAAGAELQGDQGLSCLLLSQH